MSALRVGHPCLCPREAQGDFGPEDGGQADGGGGFGEPDGPVHAVVVGDGQRLEAQAHCLFHQLVGVRSTIEEAEIGVAMQLGVRGPFTHPVSVRTYVRSRKSNSEVVPQEQLRGEGRAGQVPTGDGGAEG